MNAPITPIYAAVLALLFLLLSARTAALREKHRVAIGDGGNPELLRAIRVHANFAEYTPLTLLLIFMLEQGGAAAWAVHALAASLLLGRSLHAWGVSQLREKLPIRVAGMALTFTALGFSAAGLLLLALLA